MEFLKSMEAATLCEFCKRLFSDLSLEASYGTVELFQFPFSPHHTAEEVEVTTPGTTHREPFHSSLNSMLASKRMGCLICSQLIDQVHPDLLDFTHSLYYFRLGSLWQRTANGRFRVPDLELEALINGYYPIGVSVHQIEESDSLTEYAVGASKADSTDDPRVSRLIQRWMTECLGKHQRCAPVEPTTWHPDRLLALDKTTVRLKQGPAKITSGCYATVSHCWGDFLKSPRARHDHILVLDDQSEEALTIGVPLFRLPQTVPDVAMTLQRLGVNFLWMDCYCIKQRGDGCAVDKQIQIAAMADIYANAILNVSATSARDPFDGCFHTRSSKVNHHYLLWRPTSQHDRSYFHIAAKQQPDAYDFSKDMPLMKRGWVLQERILSKRILHLCREQVLWECKDLQTACETHPYGIRSVHVSKTLAWHIYSFNIEAFGNQTDLWETATWEHVVNMYSQMALSWPNDDKLAAISGIAKRVAVVLDDTYVAGLWRKTLVDDLCWRVYRNSRRAVEWRAPSWSWASIEGRLRMLPYAQSSEEQDDISVINVSLAAVDPSNRFSALRSATLTLEGRLIEAVVIKQDKQATADVDVIIAEASGRSTCVVMDEEGLTSPTVMLLMMKSRTTCCMDKPDAQRRFTYGIVLRGLSPGTYERIGMWHTDWLEEENIYDIFMQQNVERFTLV